MKKIVVISDTHMHASGDRLPEAVLEEMKGADLIIHAGDMTEEVVLDSLKKLGHVEAVLGNMDSHRLKRILPDIKILKIDNFKIGITHGFGTPAGILEYVQDKFKDQKLDCIIYGHSHIPKIDYIDDTLYFCPGSPTEKIYSPYNAFGILEIGEKITPKIIRL